jgi:small subunit ribosomal protein S6
VCPEQARPLGVFSTRRAHGAPRKEVNAVRTYEALYIVRPDIKDDEVQTVAKNIEALVTDQGGTIVRSELWGKRKLAYEVKHFTEGFYVLTRFTSEASFVARLESYFRLAESVIRFLVVYFDEKTLQLEEEQKAQVEAEIRASAARHALPRTDDDDDDDDDDGPRRRSFGRDDSDEDE